ncbi:polyamine-modulated factor 1-binding protein 1-like isoform X1 [Eurosta solidaginis]|uniref:polyamine-modulated factor 1-binding protein 1-like isoform X1 n=1 Tax=Eurosta solidaginis TaxID=178769 RepID=UPI0035308739
MEVIEQLAQRNGSQYNSTESNSNSESDESIVSTEKIDHKTDRQSRKPTRRPNPNVQNRNALLARENRRKKKEHLEAMEKELEEVRSTNKRLKKALKQQMKAVGQLEREKRYFQSILANHKEIENLIKALNVRMHAQQMPTTASSPMLYSPGQSNCIEKLYGSSNDIFQQIDTLDDDGCKNSNCEVNLSPASELSDYDLATSKAFNDTLSDLLDDDMGTKDLTQLTTVSEEHCYADVGLMSSPKCTDTDAGICLHIRQGKISLEFCPSCSWNSNDYTVANTTF